MQFWLAVNHLKSSARCRIQLTSTPLIVGRASPDDVSESKFGIDFDPMLSRRHFQVYLEGEHLQVRALENRHPLYLKGEEVRQFRLEPGQHFTSGQTGFEFAHSDSSLGHPTRTHTVMLDLSQLRELDSQRCLRVLLDLQPLMSSLDDPEALLIRALPMLGQIVPMASALLVVASRGEELTTVASHGKWSGRPSRTLIHQSLNHQEATCFFWDQETQAGSATMAADVRWAVAAPIWAEGISRYVLYAVGSEVPLSSSASGRTPGELDRAVLTFVATMLGQHFRGRWSALQVEEERRQKALAQVLREILETLSRSLHPEQVLEKFQEHLKRHLGFDRVRCFGHRPEEVAPRALWSLLGEGLDAAVLKAADERAGGLGFPNQGSILGLSIRGRQSVLALLFLHRNQGEFTAEQQSLAGSLALQAGVALENALMFQRMERMASTDELTGVSNRRHFFEQARALEQQAVEHSEPLQVLLIDIDHFKKFNDTHGHQVGDLVLQKVAQLARLHLPHLGRYGGEEFAAVARGREVDLVQKAEKLRAALASEGLRLGEQVLTITISVGVASGLGVSLSSLLQQADERLYQAKARGRNCVVSS